MGNLNRHGSNNIAVICIEKIVLKLSKITAADNCDDNCKTMFAYYTNMRYAMSSLF